MKLKKKFIGVTFGTRLGMVTIENDESKFAFYKALDLDVFTSSSKSDSKRESSPDTDGENDDK